MNKFFKYFILTTFISLYVVVSIISTIHVIEFFSLSNPRWLAISLAIAFEIGAAAALGALVVLDKMNKTLVWSLFILLTLMQMMGNTYYAFVNLKDYTAWIELFGLTEESVISQKRILSIISGAILPLIALGFIKSLVDYFRAFAEIKTTEDIVVIKEASNNPEILEVPDEPLITEVTEMPEISEVTEPNVTEDPIQEELVQEETKENLEKKIYGKDYIFK